MTHPNLTLDLSVVFPTLTRQTFPSLSTPTEVTPKDENKHSTPTTPSWESTKRMQGSSWKLGMQTDSTSYRQLRADGRAGSGFPFGWWSVGFASGVLRCVAPLLPREEAKWRSLGKLSLGKPSSMQAPIGWSI